jgi:hypothetical protein
LKRSNSVASLLFPIPFLLGVAIHGAIFWQNDWDFAFGKTKSIDATYVDRGESRSSRGRTSYYPRFKLADGTLLTLERSLSASELPLDQQPLQLLCSKRRPTNCKTPRAGSNFLYYGLASVWSAGAVGIALLMWLPRYRSHRHRS